MEALDDAHSYEKRKEVNPFFLILLSLLIPFLSHAENYYVESRSYGTQKLPESPKYVKPFNDLIELGVDYRIRYEYRDNDFRRNREVTDNPLLHRTRLYVSSKTFWEPLRLRLEVADARRSNSHFEKDSRDVNQFEPIQGYGQLLFKEMLGPDRPLDIRLGRMAFEQIDRRLIARNEWRNTTNTFEGLRTILGQQTNDWSLDMFALQPLARKMNELDTTEIGQHFYGAIGDLRRWSQVATFEPYYLLLTDSGKTDRRINTGGLRAYGVIKNSELDYDLNFSKQWGKSAGQDHDASSANAELGYTLKTKGAPRLSANYGYASGDKDPNDNKNQRFERLFGFSRPWSNNDYIQMENIRALKFRFEFEPVTAYKIDFGYGRYQLASATDRWSASGLRDRTGKSGKDIGHELDVRARFPLTNKVSTQMGYAYFSGGDFTKKTSQKIDAGRSPESHFVYTELVFTLF